MNDEHKKIEHHERHLNNSEKPGKDYALPISILMSALILAGAWIYTSGLKSGQASQQIKSQTKAEVATSALQEKILPSAGVVLPVKWGDIGMQMINNGVIDSQKFQAIYANRGGMQADTKALLQKSDNGSITITPRNSGEILNLLWAFGLSNKNLILENGPMQDPRYGGAERFASTGGWTVAKGDVMNHYSKYNFVTLTADQQALVEEVAKNIYRPCCGNSVYFPDCNHGMAMLGLIELMAAQNVSENDMYKIALAVNSYWFPDTYLTIAKYLKNNNIEWNSIAPKTLLGASYSSAQGYARIQSLVAPEPSTQQQGGSGCGVGGGQPASPELQRGEPTAQPQQQQSGCGV